MVKRRKPNYRQLITAIERRDVQLLRQHLADGADCNAILTFSTGKSTLLGYAAGCQFLEGVKLLLKAGADPNKTTTSESASEDILATALDEAIEGDDINVVENNLERRYEIVDLLLKAGANVNDLCGGDSLPLYAAARGGYFNICKRLIDAGAWVKELPTGCMPPLFGAVYNCFEDEERDKIVNLLMKHGAPIEAETPWGATALMAASWRGVDSLAKLFLERGADPNRQTTHDGQTPLTYAALYFKNDAFDEERQQRALCVVKRLLKAGANPTVRNKEGESAFDIASGGKSSIVADYIKNFTENIRRAK